jgi:uncharacterized protein YbjQ (UPF0145 family)
MLITTTPQIEGKKVKAYLGLVSGEAIMGADIFKDLDYETLGQGGNMLMVSASGTAVKYEEA